MIILLCICKEDCFGSMKDLYFSETSEEEIDNEEWDIVQGQGNEKNLQFICDVHTPRCESCIPSSSLPWRAVAGQEVVESRQLTDATDTDNLGFCQCPRPFLSGVPFTWSRIHLEFKLGPLMDVTGRDIQQC